MGRPGEKIQFHRTHFEEVNIDHTPGVFSYCCTMMMRNIIMPFNAFECETGRRWEKIIQLNASVLRCAVAAFRLLLKELRRRRIPFCVRSAGCDSKTRHTYRRVSSPGSQKNWTLAAPFPNTCGTHHSESESISH